MSDINVSNVLKMLRDYYVHFEATSAINDREIGLKDHLKGSASSTYYIKLSGFINVK